MAYELQTPEEQAYMDLFNKNDRAIWDYKNARGVSLEDAFQAVTGRPWMEGRSVKHNRDAGAFEMTKDRTFGSVLGKYVLPIAGAAVAPFALPALLGVGGAAAAGGGVAGGGLGTGALAAGATIPGAGMASGIGATGAGSVFAGLGKSALDRAMGGGASNAAAAASQSMASNRGAKTAAMLDEQSQFEEQLLDREIEKRRAQSAAYRNAMVGSNGMNFAPAPRPSRVTTPSYTTGPTAEGRMAGGELYSQAMRRMLQPDLVNPTAPPALNRLNLPLDSSKTEKALGVGSFFSKLLGF